MKHILRYFDWELSNEFYASGYFCAMMFCYGIVEWIYGNREVDIITILEMFLLNYVISTMQKLVLDEDKEYDIRTFRRRAAILTVVSIALIIASCHGLGWFDGRSIYAELFMYVCMVSAYIFVWLMRRVAKHLDTKQLNEDLLRYKQKEQEK